MAGSDTAISNRSSEENEDPDEEPTLIQVSNIAPTATVEQIKTLFSFLGEIIRIELYFGDDDGLENNTKVAFIEYSDFRSVQTAQHLTSTIFIDRPLIVLPYTKKEFPDEVTAMSKLKDNSLIINSCCGVVNQIIVGPGGGQVIATIDPKLTALGLPQYPNLPINIDSSRVEEIRRTVYIGNLDSTLTPDQVMKFFNDIGEVKYIRLAGDDTQPTRFAFVEFTDQSSIANALQHNGFMFGSRPLKINHSNNAIVKPQPRIDKSSGDADKPCDLLSAEKVRNHSSSSNNRRSDRRDQDRNRDSSRDGHKRYSRREGRSHGNRSPLAYSSKRNRSRGSSSDKSRDRSHRDRSRSPHRRSRSREHRRRSRSRGSRHRSRSRDSRHHSKPNRHKLRR